jgi:hypothetical protein
MVMIAQGALASRAFVMRLSITWESCSESAWTAIDSSDPISGL